MVGVVANGQRVSLVDRTSTADAIVCTEQDRNGPRPGMAPFIERAAAAVLHSYHEWDVAGSVALAIEAGAAVLDRHGEDAPLPVDGLRVREPAS